MKRLIKSTVMLNGVDISHDVTSLSVFAAPDEVMSATLNVYLNDITKDEDGGLVYWVGSDPCDIRTGDMG